jgi:hypothetical protein
MQRDGRIRWFSRLAPNLAGTVAALCLAAGLAPCAGAQDASSLRSRLSVGGLAGRTSGLTMRIVLADESARSGPFDERAVDVNASFNLDGYLLLTSHVTAERPVENSPLNFYIGPGWLVGAEDGSAFFGASGNVGIYFMQSRYQILLQLMPGLRVAPDLDGEVSAAVGMRISF